MLLYCKNVNILLATKYCTLTWCNSFMQAYVSMLTIQSVFCVYTSFSEYVLGWFFSVLFIATHGEQMYTIGNVQYFVANNILTFLQYNNIDI
jgi:hypothetical protein